MSQRPACYHLEQIVGEFWGQDPLLGEKAGQKGGPQKVPLAECLLGRPAGCRLLGEQFGSQQKAYENEINVCLCGWCAFKKLTIVRPRGLETLSAEEG